MPKLNALVLDIETSPLIAYAWGRRDVNIALNQIKQDQAVMAWAAKWRGDPASDVAYADQRNAKVITDDRAILARLWRLLDQADILVTQNGKAFDSKFLNSRFIMHGMKPPSAYKHLDTYLIARSVGRFTSNSLEYLTDKLCTKYKKLTHSKFPGMALWTECLAGNVKAWDEMKRYNIHDVLATEELYTKLSAWAPVSAPPIHILAGCGACGSKELQLRGYNHTRIARFRKLVCKDCGRWTMGPREAL